MSVRPIDVAILGAGQRGWMFGELVEQFGGRVVAVAEPDAGRRDAFARRHGLPAGRVYVDWRAFVEQPKACDAVVVSTMDRDHAGPAVACLDLGYHLLLEKPMAVTVGDCRAIADAAARAGTVTSVCHSLRYHHGFARVKALIDEGRIGQVVTVDQLEQVGFWHQAHSFVRGNWGSEERSTFMLLAKSCHDIDYIAYLVGAPCRRVSSFGSLTHFTPANAPAGSAARCTDGCAVEGPCAYSALKAYVDTDRTAWPASVVSLDHSRDAHLEAVRTGPYGRCVYAADNDVVDHQVVALEFDSGITATFTMTAFTQGGGRRVRVHGTAGTIDFDEASIVLRTFADGRTEIIAIAEEAGGHGGGDARVVRAWLHAIATGDRAGVVSDIAESARTHRIVFAAEEARRTARVVEV